MARVRWLGALGVDGLLIVTPAYVKPTQDGLIRHYTAAAEASSVPILLYNVPGRTAVDLLPPTVARLATVPNIVALKEAVGDLERVRELSAQGRPQTAAAVDWPVLNPPSLEQPATPE